MAASDKLVDQAADELYGLPPGEFTSARDELAKRLRKDDREAANAVKALRKPTVAAWALNQLARERRKDLDALLAAGDKLQSAQEKLLAGGDRASFQRAAATERELVATLAAEAISLTSESGERPGAGLEEKVAATLHAAALDEETADQLRAGRLVREREAIGGFGSFGDAEPAAEPRSRGSSGKAPARPAAGARGSRVGSSGGTKRAARAKSSAADAAARERLAGARTDERHARRELDAAAKAVSHAQERSDAAAAHAAEAREREQKTAERLREAKQAETAAKKAHTKASKALKSAETAARKR
jgi:hypothetical protein